MKTKGKPWLERGGYPKPTKLPSSEKEWQPPVKEPPEPATPAAKTPPEPDTPAAKTRNPES